MTTRKVFLVLSAAVAICPLSVRAEAETHGEIALPPSATEASRLGEKISRTMTDLATSTPEDRKKVKVLFYGQSITAQSWSHALAEHLKKEYPNADITVENRAIGGFTAERLLKTAEQDLYPFCPDLVIFHAYLGANGELEEIVSNIRKRTTAEIVLATHHVSNPGNADAQKEHEKTSQLIRDIAARYDCELVEVREEWKQYLQDNNLEIQDLLQDQVHLNPKGCDLMEALMWRHFRYSPTFPNPHSEWIKTVPVKAAPDGRIKVDFTGNRVDLIAGTSHLPPGTAAVKVDGQPPSANPLSYICTLPSRAFEVWWPALYTVGHRTMPVEEDWVLKLTDIRENGSQFHYTVTGSRTGPDGAGDNSEVFVSHSGRVVIDPADLGGVALACQYTHKPCPDGFEIHWSVFPLCQDIYRAGEKTATTIVQGIENADHTLEIIPLGDGAVPVDAVRIYTPLHRCRGSH